jgi:probable F420-dependent oxidoreductase
VLYAITIFPTEYTAPPDEIARQVEARGFESIWFPEHTHIPAARKTPWPGGPDLPREYYHTLDPFVACTAVAMATSSLKVATGICLVVQHHPITLAKLVSSVDQVSHGRFIFGIGGGWNKEEVEHHGTAFKTRFRLLRERVLAMKALWTEEKAQFHGNFVDFDESVMNPKPVQQPNPPIIMGGDGPTTFDRVVEFCDGWMPISRGVVLPPGLADKVVELRRRAEGVGRDPDKLSITLFGCPPTREAIEEAGRAGVGRVIFAVRPEEEPAKLWQTLDERAKLIR